MDIVDRDVEKAERAANPEPFPYSFPADARKRPEQMYSPEADSAKVERRDIITSSGSTASSSSASIVRKPIGMSRVNT